MGNDIIDCNGDYCDDMFTNRQVLDRDEDGFYNWGIEAYPPSGVSGITKMDYDDKNKNIICMNDYTPLNVPYISNTSSIYLCSTGRTFKLENFDDLSDLGFSVHWSVMPAYYFNSDSCGNTATAVVTPNPSYIGKKSKIKFTISYNGVQVPHIYKFEFYINGPREDLVSTSVLDSYGESAQGSDDYYYLCPNSNYTIYYNNYDGICTTSSFEWTLPYGWTENYRYSNYISINTNDYPTGYLQIYANTSCCGSSINVKNIYFGEAYCGEYFMAYPNPASSFVDIDVIKEKLSSLVNSSDERCTLSVVDKSGVIKSKFNFIGFPYRLNTSNLPEGLYFINIQIKDIKSTIRLSIKH